MADLTVLKEQLLAISNGLDELITASEANLTKLTGAVSNLETILREVQESEKPIEPPLYPEYKLDTWEIAKALMRSVADDPKNTGAMLKDLCWKNAQPVPIIVHAPKPYVYQGDPSKWMFFYPPLPWAESPQYDRFMKKESPKPDTEVKEDPNTKNEDTTTDDDDDQGLLNIPAGASGFSVSPVDRSTPFPSKPEVVPIETSGEESEKDPEHEGEVTSSSE